MSNDGALMTRRVVHYTDAIEYGGAERMILTLLSGLRAQGWWPVLVHHGGPGIRRLTDGATALGIETCAVEPMRGSLAALRFTRQLRRLAPTLFHAHLRFPAACRPGLIAAKLAGLPVVATVQLYMDIGGRRAIYPQRLLSLAVDRYIAVSRHVALRMRSLCLNGANKIRVVHNGVPIEEFEASSSGHVREAGAHATVVSLARLDSQKGLRYLVGAAALLPEARFVVAGDGRDREALEAQARALGLGERFEFLGHRDDVAALLRSADVFVLPSLYEGLPVSVLEAMAAGTPVVATAVGGTDEAVVHGESGILVRPRDPEALARAIREVLSDPALARTLVAGGRARVRAHFSAEAVARGVCEIYEELAPRPVRRARCPVGSGAA